MNTKRKIQALLSAATAMLILSGCATPQGPGTASPSVSSPAPAASPTTAAPTTEPTTPQPTTTLPNSAPPTGSAAIVPATCDEIGTAEHRANSVDKLSPVAPPPEYPNGPAGATTLIDCQWFAGDISSAGIRIATADDDNARVAREGFIAQGYSCAESDFGVRCELVRNETYSGHGYTIVNQIDYDGKYWVESGWSNGEFGPVVEDVLAGLHL